VVMTPKSLLRHKLAISTLDELAEGSFQHLITDPKTDTASVTRVVVCSGKVYYDLLEERKDRSDIALLRVEQLYPFPRELLSAELARLSQASEIIWCQEEPQNQGAWYQIRHHGQKLGYAGRARSPSPAVGHFNDHLAEQKQLVADALVNPLNGKPVSE